MKTLETARLIIDEITSKDASFILQMLNDPTFIKYVADRGIRTEEQARAYIQDRVVASYEEHGFAMGAVRLKDSGEVIGMCGLVNRDTLEDIDIGYGFLPKFRGKGYALEAAVAVMKMGREDFGLQRLLAIIHPANTASRALAEKMGMHCESMISLTPDEDEICLYSWSD
ncbi:MAG: ribosomal-protein-alanine N-acetyltransferase [Halioglobus sp.]|jgi:ribosomal-protein-alanine N-acetyltransferase